VGKDAANGLRKFMAIVAATIVVTLLVQSGVLIYWCGCTETRLDNVELRIDACCPLVGQVRSDVG